MSEGETKSSKHTGNIDMEGDGILEGEIPEEGEATAESTVVHNDDHSPSKLSSEKKDSSTRNRKNSSSSEHRHHEHSHRHHRHHRSRRHRHSNSNDENNTDKEPSDEDSKANERLRADPNSLKSDQNSSEKSDRNHSSRRHHSSSKHKSSRSSNSTSSKKSRSSEYQDTKEPSGEGSKDKEESPQSKKSSKPKREPDLPPNGDGAEAEDGEILEDGELDDEEEDEPVVVADPPKHEDKSEYFNLKERETSDKAFLFLNWFVQETISNPRTRSFNIHIKVLIANLTSLSVLVKMNCFPYILKYFGSTFVSRIPFHYYYLKKN